MQCTKYGHGNYQNKKNGYGKKLWSLSKWGRFNFWVFTKKKI